MRDEEFRELYVRMATVVFSFAARQLTPDQARDVVAETFEVLWRTRTEVPSNHDEWPAWLIGIAKNKVRHERQRTRRKHHDNRFIDDYPSLSGHASSPDIADSVADSVAGRWVWNQLNSEERELVNIAFVQGVSDTEASALVGISTTAYTTRLSRVRKRIAELNIRSANDPRDIQKSETNT
ncbi:MAG: RNA polymerase sigma factor [Aeromicrobium sp.]